MQLDYEVTRLGGEHCNDVFGARPTLLVVQGPGDQGPFDAAIPTENPPPPPGCSVTQFPSNKHKR
jgi:hypothetical protein